MTKTDIIKQLTNESELIKDRKGLSEQQKQFVRNASRVFGCYVLHREGAVIYVGKSFNIGQRLMTHFCGRYHDFNGSVVVFDLTKIASDMNHMEAREYLSYYETMLIRKLRPSNNKKLKKNAISWDFFASLSIKVQSAILSKTESIL